MTSDQRCPNCWNRWISIALDCVLILGGACSCRHREHGPKLTLLLDRVLVSEGKPQVYGTQAKAVEQWRNGSAQAEPIEDEAHVDQRRKSMGLAPLSDYLRELYSRYLPTDLASSDSTTR